MKEQLIHYISLGDGLFLKKDALQKIKYKQKKSIFLNLIFTKKGINETLMLN